MASDAGQEMSDGVLLEEADVVELVVVPTEEVSVAVELEMPEDDPDCEGDVPVLELETVDVVLELSVKSFAPQIPGMFTTGPTVFLR